MSHSKNSILRANYMAKLEEKEEELTDTILDQLTEDRTMIKDMYDKLAHQTTSIQEFAMNGLTMVKLLELAQKQTGQIADIVAAIKKTKPKTDNENLNPTEAEDLWKDVEKK